MSHHDLSKTEDIVKKHNFEAGQLIGILQDVQAEYNYLPRHPLEKVAELLKIPMSQVFSVASFFKAFSLKPRGKHLVHVCMGTACHVRGAKRVLEEFERELNLKEGRIFDRLAHLCQQLNVTFFAFAIADVR